MSGGDLLAGWPAGTAPLSAAELTTRWAALQPAFLERLAAHAIPADAAEALAGVYLPLAAWVEQQRRPGVPLILGVNGAQGSGKSTLCDFLQFVLEQSYGLRAAGFSIDDLYKTRAEREAMAREVHPLFLTRGVPGTHDVQLGIGVLEALTRAGSETVTPIPAFDKASDDRRPNSQWPDYHGRPDVIIFEGWCVGTSPQDDAALLEPINALEAEEDADGAWRQHVNDELRGAYAQLFGRLHQLIMLRVPSMDSVFEWRSLQEQKLAAITTGAGHRLMDAAGIRRFIMHYERLTRHNLAEMPDRADLVLQLDGQHRFTDITGRVGPSRV